MKPFTEKEVLDELDKAFSDSRPLKAIQTPPYDFFLDLEPPYTYIAGSRIHLFSDSTNWAVVFETTGYNTRATLPQIQLVFVGNCINFHFKNFYGENEQTNTFWIDLMTPKDLEAIENKIGSDIETFEKVGKEINKLKIREKWVSFEKDPKVLERYGINITKDDNPNCLISFEDLFRYLDATQPSSISATKKDIEIHLKRSIPLIMTINKFHYRYPYTLLGKEILQQNKDKIIKEQSYNSILGDETLPSNQELFQLIAKILVTKDTTYWKPTLPPNNHWRNWKSGAI